MDVNVMRNKYSDIMSSLISNKRQDNKAILSAEEYSARIEDVHRAKNVLNTAGLQKTLRDYRIVKKFDVLVINGKERLIKPVSDNAAPVLYYVTNEELFDIIHSTHSAIGHGGRNRMIAELNSRYCNITTESIMVYLRLCVHCQRKSSHPTKGLVSNPILHSAFNSRAQVDLIDMQSQSLPRKTFK